MFMCEEEKRFALELIETVKPGLNSDYRLPSAQLLWREQRINDLQKKLDHLQRVVELVNEQQRSLDEACGIIKRLKVRNDQLQVAYNGLVWAIHDLNCKAEEAEKVLNGELRKDLLEDDDVHADE